MDSVQTLNVRLFAATAEDDYSCQQVTFTHVSIDFTQFISAESKSAICSL